MEKNNQDKSKKYLPLLIIPAILILILLAIYIAKYSYKNDNNIPKEENKMMKEKNDKHNKVDTNYEAIYIKDNLFLMIENNEVKYPIYVNGTKDLKFGDRINFKATAFTRSLPPSVTVEEYTLLKEKNKELDISFDAAKELKEMINNVEIIDVREKEEFDSGHIKDAKLIELSKLPKAVVDKYTKDTILIVYCRTGPRAREAQKLLEAEGYLVFSAGGITFYDGDVEK